MLESAGSCAHLVQACNAPSRTPARAGVHPRAYRLICASVWLAVCAILVLAIRVPVAHADTAAILVSGDSAFAYVDGWQASGDWALYKIYVNDVLIGTKTADSDPTWYCPGMDIPRGSHIDIVADCGFSQARDIVRESTPITYALTLPVDATRLEPATWTGFADECYEDWFDDEWCDEVNSVWIPPAAITNIVYSMSAPPTGTVSIDAGAACTNSTNATLTLTQGGTGISQMRFSTNGTSWGAWTPYAASSTVSLPDGDGTKTVTAQYGDNTGKVLVTVSDTIVLDTTAPTGTMSLNAGAACTASVSATVNSAVSDTLSGVHQMSIDAGSGYGSWIPYAASSAVTLPSGDGTKTVAVRYKDDAGNVVNLTDTIVLDTTAPTGTMSVNGGAAYAASTSATVNSAVSDALSGVHQMSVDAGSGYGSWITYAASSAVTLPSGDGTKTVNVKYKDDAGNVVTLTDTIVLDTVAPTFGSATPAPSSVVSTLSPAISVPVTDGSGIATYTLSVNGTSVAAVYESGQIVERPTITLSDETDADVRAQVTDGAGNVGVRSWTFHTQTRPEMPGDTSDCGNCHQIDLTHHHQAGRGDDCTWCHFPWGSPGLHLGPTSSYHPSPDAACQPCHSSSLTLEHNGRTTQAGDPITCLTCHQSTDPQVAGAIDSGNADCSACHTVPDHTAVHDTTVNASCAGVRCHSGTNLTTIHTGTCDSCHKSTDPKVVAAIAGHDKDCTACHDQGHTTVHDTTGQEDCSGSNCHASSNLLSVHINSRTTLTCQTCHSSTDPNVVAAIGAGNTACSACHSAAHSDDTALHVSSGGTAHVDFELDDDDHWDGDGPYVFDADCALCHGNSLLTVHSSACSTCHASDDPNVVAAIAGENTNCTACHPDQHSSVSHEDIHDSGKCYCHGIGATTQEGDVQEQYCGQCHTFANVVDTIPPTTVSDARTSYVGSATIDLSASDEPLGGSQVAHTYYILDGGVQSEGTQVTVPAPSSGTQSHQLRFWSVDRAGHAESPTTLLFTVTCDTTPPVTTSNAQKAYWEGAPIGIGWHYVWSSGGGMNWPPSIYLSGTDNGTYGVQTLHYSLDGQQSAADGGSAGVTVPDPTGAGELHTLQYWSVDFAGNTEAAHTTTFTCSLDTAPPVTTTNIVPGNTYTTAQTFSLIPTDTAGGCGVSTTFWQLDSTTGGWAQGTSVSVSLPGSGSVTHTLYYYSVDHVWNTETMKSVTFTMAKPVPDTTPPTTSSSFNPTSGAVFAANQPVTLTATDNAGGSGVKNTYYKIDSGSFVSGTSFTVTGDGLHTFSYYSTDNANNTESTHVSNQFRIDTLAPSTPTLSTTSVGTSTVGLSWTAASDSGSGVAYYSVYTSAGSLVATTTGTSYTVTGLPPSTAFGFYVKARDVAGNVSAASNTVVGTTNSTPDITPPTTSASFNPASGAIFAANQPVTLTATDNAGGSGVKNTYYKIDSGSFVSGTSFTVSGDGLHTFSYYSTDNANNTESTHVSNQFKIDTIPPSTTSNITPGFTYSGAQSFTLSATDSGSGVSATYWQLDSTSGSWTSSTTVSVPAPSSGMAAHTLYFYSRDTANNAETTQSVSFGVAAIVGGSQSFSYTGAAQTFTVPAGVSLLRVTINGGGGGGGGGDFDTEDDTDASGGLDGGQSSLAVGTVTYAANGGAGGQGADSWGDDGEDGGGGNTNLDTPINLGANNGYVQSSARSWSAARNAATGTGAGTNRFLTVATSINGTMTASRSFMPFSLLGVPGIAGGRLWFSGLSSQPSSDTVGLFQGTESNSISTSDFAAFTGPELATRIKNPQPYGSGATLNLNSSAVSYLNSLNGGTAKFCVRTGDDIDNITPTGFGTNEMVPVMSQANLTLTYAGWTSLDGSGPAGGSGGDNADNVGGRGGSGGRLVGTLAVTPGSVITVNVGAGGAGGGSGNGGDDGGAGADGSVTIDY
jgi:hypothetical protein